MLNAYEQRLMSFYLANATAALHHRDREAADLADWIADRENRAAFGGRRHSRSQPCFAPNARRSRTGSVRSDSGRRGRARQVPLPVVPPPTGARYHSGVSEQMNRKSAKCGTSK